MVSFGVRKGFLDGTAEPGFGGGHHKGVLPVGVWLPKRGGHRGAASYVERAQLLNT